MKQIPEKLTKIKDVTVSEDELFGMSIERTFVEEIHVLRDRVASRLNALNSGYDNMLDEHQKNYVKKRLEEIELYCCGHEDTWFLVVERDGTVSFEKRDGNSRCDVRYTIPADWTDTQILDFEMPRRLVVEYLKRAWWTPECFLAMLGKAETKLADALSAAADSELRKVNEARRTLNKAINALEDEKHRLEETQIESKRLEEELEQFKKEQDIRIADKKKLFEEKKKIREETDHKYRALAGRIARLTKDTTAYKEKISRMKAKEEKLRKKKEQGKEKKG